MRNKQGGSGGGGQGNENYIILTRVVSIPMYFNGLNSDLDVRKSPQKKSPKI